MLTLNGILASGLSLLLSITPMHAFAPTNLTATFRFNQPVLGEVCIEAEAMSEDAEIFYRSSCEGINGSVKQIRWYWNWVGEYRMRATYRGGTEKVVTPYKLVRILAPPGR